jgi:phosphatidylglycerol:prolipoprotein diacylglycerol transferase
MIPFFTLEYFFIGPIKIYVWGFFVALGIITAVYILSKKGFFRPPAGDRNFNLIIYLVFAAIIGGRLGYVLFYDFSQFWHHPINIFKMWDGGMSSFGGFFAVALVLALWNTENRLKLLDTLTIPFLSAWIIARVGCFLIHDHPGNFTNFFLAVRFPSATMHDLAFYEILLLLPFLLFFASSSLRYRVSRRLTAVCGKVQGGIPGIPKFLDNPPVGFLFSSLIIYYSFFRFFLDFMRVLDPTWLGLTPSQYGAIIFFIFGLILTLKIKSGKLS